MTSLVEDAGQGDRQALEKLAEIFWVDVFRMIYYRTQSKEDAEDLTQDVFLRAFANLGKLREPGRFKPWLFGIALNRVRDHMRRKKIINFIGFSGYSSQDESPEMRDPHTPSAQALVMRREFWRHVQGFSKRLAPSEREAFTLRYLDQLTIPEIAQVLGKSQSSVKTHLYRAVAKFKKNKHLRKALQGV
ncbi:MAG: RNA polymerase sigma factor [Desulfarculaceae bacterium]